MMLSTVAKPDEHKDAMKAAQEWAVLARSKERHFEKHHLTL